MSDIFKIPTPNDLRRLADTPGAGKAAIEIREKYDPNFGLGQGEEWTVTLEYAATVSGIASQTVRVFADTREQAIARAKHNPPDDWEFEADLSADIEMDGSITVGTIKQE